MASLKTFGIAVGAGLTSALLFAASARGGPLAFVLMCVTPLPVAIATLGFAQATGLVAAAIATIVLAVLLGLLHGGIFGVLVAFPTWWLGYLALLAKPVPAPAAGAAPLAWFPIGRVVLWAAFLVSAVMLAFGGATLWHYGSYENTVSALAAVMKARLDASEAERPFAMQADFIVRLMPPVIAGLVFVVLSVNLWIAGRVVQGSGLLSRPWPALPENLRLPRVAALILIAAGVLTLVGGAIGVACGVVVAPLSMAFVFQGLGTAHALTRGFAARRTVLLAIYFFTLSLTPSLLALAVLGLVDCLLPLRRPRAVSPSPSN